VLRPEISTNKAPNHEVNATLLSGPFTKEALTSAKPLIQQRSNKPEGVFWKTFSRSSVQPWGSIHGPRGQLDQGGGVSGVKAPGLLEEPRSA
jgi:hypothetical protein